MADSSLLFVDYETRSCADLEKVGAYNYLRHPTTEIIIGGFLFDNEPAKKMVFWRLGEPLPERVKAHGGKIVAHNSAFELAVHVFLVPDAPARFKEPENYICTMATAYRWGLPAKLEKVADILRVKYRKKGFGKDLIKLYSMPFKPTQRELKAHGLTKNSTPEQIANVWETTSADGLYWRRQSDKDQKLWKEYLAHDILSMREIYRTLPPIDGIEREIFELDGRINQHGFRVDTGSVKLISNAYFGYMRRAGDEAKKFMGLAKSGKLAIMSPVAFKAWLKSEGFRIPNTQAKTLQLLQQRLQSGAVKCPVAKVKRFNHAIDLRSVLAAQAPKKFQAMLEYSDENGIVRNALQYSGSHTLRWAGRGLQPHNFVRDCAKEAEFDSLAIQYVSGKLKFKEAHTVAGKLLRPLIIPRSGCVFLTGDFSAIEARAASYLTDCRYGLMAFSLSTNRDPYMEFADNLPVKHLDAATRRQNIGKLGMLSLQYGRGAETTYGSHELQSLKMPNTKRRELAEMIVRLFRRQMPEIVDGWHRLEVAFKLALRSKTSIACKIKFSRTKSTVRLTFPNGREMSIFRPRLDNNVLTYEHPQRGRVRFWGGVIMEWVSSGFSRDILAEKMLEIDREIPGGQIVLTVHDEIILEHPKKNHKQAFKKFTEIMHRVPEWAPGFPLKSACEIRSRFGK